MMMMMMMIMSLLLSCHRVQLNTAITARTLYVLICSSLQCTPNNRDVVY